MDTSKKVLCLENIWVNYDGEIVLENINLTVYQSDFLAIIGPNGGGKTTLLKVILGLIKPQKGTVCYKIDQKNKSKPIIGYVPQRLNFDTKFPITVWDVVLSGRLRDVFLFRRYAKKDFELAEKALQDVKMYEYKDRQVGTLSGGQIQRVLIARALVCQPKLFLFDEPTASLDSLSGMNVYNLLKKVNRNIPIILVTHDIGVLSQHVNKIACLNKRLCYHNSKEITQDMLDSTYGCPVDLIAHGIPHRVLKKHSEDMVSEEL